MIFNIEAGRKALANINGLGLFANIEVVPKPDESLDGGILVEVRVKEMEPKQAEVSGEWSIAPGDTGKPSIVSSHCTRVYHTASFGYSAFFLC